MENVFIPIYYDGFWDIPDAFLTVYREQLFYFSRGGFDDELDDYPPNYKVYKVRNMALADAFEVREPPLEAVRLLNIPLLEENEIIGEIPTRNVIFDKTNRKFVNTVVFDMIQK